MKRIIQAALGKFGYRLSRVANAPKDGLICFFEAIQQAGFAPRHIVDVGANRGNWTRSAIRFFPDAQYTLVEPQDHLKVHVEDLIARGYKIRWVNAAVGDKPGILPFTIASRDDSSTLTLGEKEAQASGAHQVPMQVITLNELVASGSAPPPDLVKIDAEGFDLKVLAGASNLIGKTDIFLAEAMVCGPYENSVLDVVQYMASAGYRLIDITGLERSPKHGVLWLCELAFLRRGSPLLDKATPYE
jgi:FkbM family methyltransferase